MADKPVRSASESTYLRNKERLHADAREPLSNLRRGELRTVVAAQISRHAPTDEQIAKSLQDILALEASRHVDRQALTGVLVDERQHSNRSAITRKVRHEVIAPDVIFVRRTQPEARSISQPQTLPLGLFLRDFQTFLTPQPLDPLMIHTPTFSM